MGFTLDPGIRVTVEQNLFNVTLNASVELICAYTSDFASANVIWRRLADKPLPTQAEVLECVKSVLCEYLQYLNLLQRFIKL